MKKFLTLLFAAMLVLVVACGGGKEVAHEDEGEDDPDDVVVETTGGTGAPAAATPAAAVVADAATITGVVKLDGTAAAPPPVQMSADPFCASAHSQPALDEEVVRGAAGELANVLVYIKDAPAGPTPTTPAVLDQKGCMYIPHVSAVQVGQPVQIKNSDATLHNVHAMPAVNSQFNEGQPVQGMVSTKKFDKVELTPFRIKCDVHGWMKSFMAVLPHSYHSVSKMDGTFTIPNLPPGNYTIVAWHEKFGPQEQQITVGPKESKAVNFNYKS